MNEKIKTREEIAKIVAELKTQGKKIITTNGCFDILHTGHATYLEQAKKLGDVLIVGLNSDASVRTYKGPERPINKQEDRALMLAALESVNFVTIFEEPTPIPLLEQIKPHVHVKGGDYTKEKMCETPTVEKHGGKIVILPLIEGKSTTNIITTIKSK
ncbi:D-glycero-beta-D-manno-heptose 1-phosphate adenylyltransferase [Candidatus Woesearchaeota archaeon]|nr:D-glycero-beta-D-manno-heptose 1-phosphate adenylyltransferase [Candidatus Woesearchaeota archaeon]